MMLMILILMLWLLHDVGDATAENVNSHKHDFSNFPYEVHLFILLKLLDYYWSVMEVSAKF